MPEIGIIHVSKLPNRSSSGVSMLERKAYEKMKQWKNAKAKQALLVCGARQVGKTYLIRKFTKENWQNVVEINFYENADARHALAQANNSKEVFLRLSTFANSPIEAGKTVFFLDEIQECPEIITAIKFLLEQQNCDYILSGSMLGTELKGIKSAPVGYLNTITMFPLDFEEFCWANSISKDLITYVKQQIEETSVIDDYVNKRFLDLFYKYLISGGMPEAVKAFAETNNISTIRTAQEAIVTQYRWDISKYATDKGNVIRRIFDLIPSEIAKQDKKFTFKSVSGNSHFNRYDNDFLWLIDAYCALPVYNVSQPCYPLPSQINPSKFKLFSSDVGLLTFQSGMDVARTIINTRTDINYGAIYENAVAQELKAHGHALCYYKKRNIGELDFLIRKRNQVIPVEVKSGKSYARHVALTKVLATKNYHINRAIVLYDGNVSVQGKVVYLPVYACAFL